MTRRQTIVFAVCCWVFVVFSFIVSHCHSSAHAQATQPTLIGTWYLQSFDNKYFDSGTIVVLTLRSDGRYALTSFIMLINGFIGSETELGTFSSKGHTVRFVPVSSTCARRSHNPRGTRYMLAATTLVLRGVHKNHVFRRSIVFNEAIIIRQLDTSLVPPIQGCFNIEHRSFTFTE